jgi:putative SOS response-associated peptidase YedK
MCGRFTMDATLEDLFIALKIKARFNLMARYNIAPGQAILAARLSDKGEREFTHFKWGLIPSWMKTPPTTTTLINARIETVAEKPSFRTAYKRRRCLIPASGFYEWQKTAGPKQPYYIYMKGEAVMTFAGIWEHWTDAGGSEIETAAIITAPASKSIEGIHHRMPVVVGAGDRDGWLTGGKGAMDVVRSNIEFDYHPVSRAVNNVRNEDKSLISPDEPFEDQTLF